jgi:hypothetical protein
MKPHFKAAFRPPKAWLGLVGKDAPDGRDARGRGRMFRLV